MSAVSKWSTAPNISEDRVRPSPGHAFGALVGLAARRAGNCLHLDFLAGATGAGRGQRRVAGRRRGLPDPLLADAGVLAADGTRLLWSPDGQQVTAVIARVGEPASRLLWQRPISATTWLPVTPPAHVVDNVCWTGDSRVLVYTTADGGLYWVDANGGVPVQLVQATRPQVMGDLRCPAQP
ncbi:MAG: hypothetical protein HZY76_16090 [Anaerolineae bacterium]|nr:MAG: hypothetical protein HZY76_16090 [Anaerolineae bacterium]